jgi:membrane protease YdiL (CAAX protease family)
MYALLAAVISGAALLWRGALPALHFRLSATEAGIGLSGIVVYAAYNALFPALLSQSAAGRSLLALLATRNRTLFGKLPLWTMLLMALLAGVCEEVLFRGWLQPLTGLWLASFVFALVHFPPNRYAWSHPATWAMVALYFPVGLALGWLYTWRGNLLAPVVAHALSDALGLFALSRVRAD